MPVYCSSCYDTDNGQAKPREWSQINKHTAVKCNRCGVYYPFLHDAFKFFASDALFQVDKAKRKPNRNGELPLHVAIASKCSEKVILALLKANEDDANKPNRIGELPLHDAIASKCSDEVILVLLKANKDAANKPHRNGELPLHNAIASNFSDKVILALLKANEDATNKPNRNGELPLRYAFASECSDKVILALLKANEDAANRSFGNGELPLQYAIASKCSDEVILALLKANEDAANKQNLNSELPLHDAIASKCSDKVILALLKANKDAAKWEFPFDLSIRFRHFLPLHKAIELKLSDQVILALLAAFEDAAKVGEKNSFFPMLPLHLAIERKFSNKVTKIFALHLAFKHNCSNKVILALLAANVDAASTRNHNKKLPLLVAIELKFNEEIISALVTAYPDAACDRDSNKMVMIYQAVQNGYSDTILAKILAAVFITKHRDRERVREEALSIIIQGNKEQALLKAAATLSQHERYNMLCNIIENTKSEGFLVSLVSKYPTITSMSYDDGLVNKAITYKRSDDVILALLEVNKKYAKKGKNDNHYPLHNAINQKRSDKVVLALLGANPEAAVELDYIGGNLPLHNALLKAASNKPNRNGASNFSDKVILALLKANEDAASKPNHDGELPLHDAIASKCSDEVILALLKANEDAANKQNLNSELPLHDAIASKCSDKVILALLKANKDAAKWEFPFDLSIRFRHFLPLHKAIELKLSDQVILALLAAFEDAAKVGEKNSFFPMLPLHLAIERKFSNKVTKIFALHLAFKHNCSNKVILALLAANVDAASTRNHNKKLPLLVAIELKFNEEIISALVTAYPDAACDRDSNKMVMIYQAVQNGYSDTILAKILAAVFITKHRDRERVREEALSIIIQGNKEQALLKAAATLSQHERYNMLCNIIENTKSEGFLVSLVSKYPTITSMSYDDGLVNKAITYKRSDDVILALLEVNKKYAKKGKNDNHYPLHNAINQKRSDKVVLALLGANPEAAVELDYIGGNLPLHNALLKAASNKPNRNGASNFSDKVILALLKANEDAASKPNHDGELPLHDAIASKCSDEVILALLKANEDAANKQNLNSELPLHDAIASKCSDKVILALLKANKDAAKWEFPFDLSIRFRHFLPLHKAIELKLSDQVILALLAAFEDAAKVGEKNSFFPMLPLHLAIERKFSNKVTKIFALHLAFKHNCSNKVILALLAANVDAASTRNHNKKLPLLVAIELKFNEEIISALVTAYPDAACDRDSNKMVMIYQAVQNGYSDTILAKILAAVFITKHRDRERVREEALSIIIQGNKEQALLKAAATLSQHERYNMLCNIIENTKSEGFLVSLVSKYPTITSMSYDDGLVNKAITYKRSDDVILALLEVNKKYAKKGKNDNHYPLHNAINQKRSDKVVLALLGANPEAAVELDYIGGNLPLHNALLKAASNKPNRNGASNFSDKVILALLKANEDAASKPNHDGELPLHDAIASKCSDEVILALLKANEDAANKQNLNSELPLHDAIASKCSDKVILALLKANKDAAKWEFPFDLSIRFRHFLPLHKAIELKLSDQVILALLADIDAASAKNDEQKLPLLMAIELNYNEEIISALVTAYPDAACDRDSNNMVLIYQGIQNGYSDTILAELLAAVFSSNHNDKYRVQEESLSIVIQDNMEQVVLRAAKILSDHDRYDILCKIIEKTSSESVLLSLVSKYPAITDTSDRDCEPVNKAIEYKRSDDVIFALLEANKDYAKKSKKGNNNPLHTAIVYERSDEVIFALLASNPDAAAAIDRRGRSFPLQMALDYKRSEEVVLAIFNSYKEAAQENGAHCETPLSQAINNKYSEQVVLAILDAYQGAANVVSEDDELPLHQAIEKKISDKVVLAFLDAFEKAATFASEDGWLPLHRAIEKFYSDEVILKILSAYPYAAMIRCKKSGMLPLHLAAASSASPRLVKALISQYPEALQIAVNNLIPRDLVTEALPIESIKLICRPSSHNYGMRPSQYYEKDKAEESGKTESLKEVVMEVAKMAKVLEGFCRNLFELNVKVDEVQKRIAEHSTEPNSRVLLVDNASSLVGGSTAGDFYPLGMPIAFIPPITKITGKKKKKKKNRMKKKTAEVVKENNSDPIEFSEPPSLAAVVDLSDLSCNDATLLKTSSTSAPHQSETFEPSGSFESQVDPLQLKKQQNSVITKSLLRSQTSAAECSATKVTDVCASKLSDVKVDFDEVPPASEVNSEVSFSAQSSECGTIASEANLLDVSSNGSNSANFNSFVIVGKHIREESLGAPELVDKAMMEHNPQTDNLDEMESCTFLEKVSSKSSVSGSSDGSFSFVDDGMSNKDKGESVNDNDNIISIKSSVD